VEKRVDLASGQRAIPKRFIRKAGLASKNMAVLAHPLPYSPDRAPCDFFLFPKIETLFKGTHFMSVEEVKAKRKEPLNSLTNALNSGSIVCNCV
jgi:hypothetical protein